LSPYSIFIPEGFFFYQPESLKQELTAKFLLIISRSLAINLDDIEGLYLDGVKVAEDALVCQYWDKSLELRLKRETRY